MKIVSTNYCALGLVGAGQFLWEFPGHMVVVSIAAATADPGTKCPKVILLKKDARGQVKGNWMGGLEEEGAPIKYSRQRESGKWKRSVSGELNVEDKIAFAECCEAVAEARKSGGYDPEDKLEKKFSGFIDWNKVAESIRSMK